MFHGIVSTLHLFCFLEDFSIESFMVNIRYLFLNLLFLFLCYQSLIFFFFLHAIIKDLLLTFFHSALLWRINHCSARIQELLPSWSSNLNISSSLDLFLLAIIHIKNYSLVILSVNAPLLWLNWLLVIFGSDIIRDDNASTLLKLLKNGDRVLLILLEFKLLLSHHTVRMLLLFLTLNFACL